MSLIKKVVWPSREVTRFESWELVSPAPCTEEHAWWLVVRIYYDLGCIPWKKQMEDVERGML